MHDNGQTDSIYTVEPFKRAELATVRNLMLGNDKFAIHNGALDPLVADKILTLNLATQEIQSHLQGMNAKPVPPAKYFNDLAVPNSTVPEMMSLLTVRDNTSTGYIRGIVGFRYGSWPEPHTPHMNFWLNGHWQMNAMDDDERKRTENLRVKEPIKLALRYAAAMAFTSRVVSSLPAKNDFLRQEQCLYDMGFAYRDNIAAPNAQGRLVTRNRYILNPAD